MKAANLALAFALVFTLISVASCDDVDSEHPDPLTPGVRQIFRDMVVNLINDAKDNVRSALELLSERQKDEKWQDKGLQGYLESCKFSYQETVSDLKFDPNTLENSSGRGQLSGTLGAAEDSVSDGCDLASRGMSIDDMQLEDMVQRFPDLMSAAVHILTFLNQ